MKRIIVGVLTAGTAALLLTGTAARADEGGYPPVQQAHWRGDRDYRREYHRRFYERRERERREHRRHFDRW